VDERVRREADDVEGGAAGDRQAVGRMFDLLADDVERALEAGPCRGVVVRRLAAAVRDEQLLHHRLWGPPPGPEPGGVARGRSPAETRMPFGRNRALDQLPDFFAIRRVGWQEDHARAVLARGREREPEVRRRLAEEAIGHLHEDARAVAGARLAATRAAMQQVEQHLQPLLDDAVRLAPLDIDDEADAAGVVLVGRIVETSGVGKVAGHGLPVIADHEPETKYNDPIEFIPFWNGLSAL